MRNMIYSFFDDPRISAVSKDCVKAQQRVCENFQGTLHGTKNGMIYKPGHSVAK
jgi:hypothetical protein